MRALEGQVVGGRVVIAGEELADGINVTVLVDEEKTPRLTDADVADLKASQDEIRRGEFVTTDELFDVLLRKRSR